MHTPPYGSSRIQAPTHHDAVAFPRSTFNPCDDLQQALHQLDMLGTTDDFGYSVYQKVCRVVGRPLSALCSLLFCWIVFCTFVHVLLSFLRIIICSSFKLHQS